MADALQAIRDYVTAKDNEQYSNLPEGIVSLTISHSNLQQRLIELKFDLRDSIDAVKQKIHRHVGTSPEYQRLLLRLNGQDICELGDGMLGYYSVESGMEIHVVDEDPWSLSKGGGLEDISQVQKYRMSDEDYDRREGTLRQWIKEQKEKNPNWTPPWANKQQQQEGCSQQGCGQPDGEGVCEKKPEEVPGPDSVVGKEVGQRCEISPGARRGEVAFVGEVPELKPGYWIGVRLDEPLGKHNGTIKGVKYFECQDKYGTFIRPQYVETGDFPEKDIFEDDSDEDEI